MKKIRIGVLGCAAIAKRSVIPAIKNNSDLFELICIASRSKEKAEEYASLFNCKPVIGYDNIFKENIDALYVPLPTGLHREWITKALENNLHVYAEKSLAMTFEDAVFLTNLAKQKGLALMEGYMFQYHTQHKLVKDYINRHEIGEIRLFSAAFGFPPLSDDNFRYDAQIGGGVIHDAAGYPLRALHFILGNKFDVKSSTLYYDKNKGTETYGSAFLSNGEGIGAQLAFGFDNYYQCNYEIWGSEGKIIVHRAYTPGPDLNPKITIEYQAKDNITIQAENCNHFSEAYKEFHKIINNPKCKERHYNEILLQSNSLSEIKELAL